MASAVRRIASEELGLAVEQLRDAPARDPDRAVHDARKRLKKVRSALRLVRDDIGDEVRRSENAIMAGAGRSLSGMRDAQVMIETLDAVTADPDRPAPPAEVVRSLRRALESRRRGLLDASREDGAVPAAAARDIAGVLDRVAGWPLEDESFASARAGLERIHRRGRRAMAEALDRGGGESWHDWRKRVKDLWYCGRILMPIAPAPIGAIVSDARELSDVLGDHHDLAVLDAEIEGHRGELGDEQLRSLHAVVERRRERLQTAAVPLGGRLYAEEPNAFGRRLASYWDARQGVRRSPGAVTRSRAASARRRARRGPPASWT